jgi:hypothetical protein
MLQALEIMTILSSNRRQTDVITHVKVSGLRAPYFLVDILITASDYFSSADHTFTRFTFRWFFK